MPPEGVTSASFATRRGEINRIVHDIVADLGGSISAEHGLGQLRTAEMAHYKSAVERELMKALKKTLDPQNLMNPDKVVV